MTTHRILLIAAISLAAQSLLCPALPAPDCLPGSDCSTLDAMIPPLQLFASSQPGVTAQLSPHDRAAFEHLLGSALATTSAVQWVTRELASRMRRFVVGAAGITGTSPQEALMQAFAPSRCVGCAAAVPQRLPIILILARSDAFAVSPAATPGGWGRRLMPSKLP
jgi:hypothetical protein